MSRIKDNAKNFIVEEASKLFLEKSIISVTMSDIAKKVDIGEATLYRYFQKKQNIVLQASVKMAQNVISEYFPVEESRPGYEQMASFFTSYPRIFNEHPEYFKFIDELDAYIITEVVSDKNEYENSVDVYKKIFDKAYETGLADKTLKPLADKDTFYYSTTHSLLNLCKFLSAEAVLSHDKKINKTKEIQVLTDIILEALRA